MLKGGPGVRVSMMTFLRMGSNYSVGTASSVLSGKHCSIFFSQFTQIFRMLIYIVVKKGAGRCLWRHTYEWGLTTRNGEKGVEDEL